VASDCKIINGHLHSPYFIFIRAAGWLSDRDILTFLGLSDFVASPPGRDLRTRAVVAALHERAAGAPTFACAVGGSDWSVDLCYYASGALNRRYVVADPHYDQRQRIVTEDFGKCLPGERAISEIGGEQEYVLSLAVRFGVKINHQLNALRCYAKPEPLQRS
jgi:hypothetical protein